MMQNLTRVRTRMLCALAIAPWLALPFRASAQPAPPLKVAFVYVTPVGQAGWTYQHDLGRREMERELGGAVRTTVVEDVAEGPDAERVMRDLARQGHRLIFATSFGYLEGALRVAAEFPLWHGCDRIMRKARPKQRLKL